MSLSLIFCVRPGTVYLDVGAGITVSGLVGAGVTVGVLVGYR